MKKRLYLFLCVVLAICCLASFAGCTTTTDDPAKPTDNTSEATATAAPGETAAPTSSSDETAKPTSEPTKKPKTFIDELREGYTVNLGDLEFSNQPELIKISDIKDPGAKQAFLDNGHKEDDKVLYITETPEKVLTVFDDTDMWEAGYEYVITLETYNPSKGGGYLIALNSTSANNTFASNVIKTGYKNSSFDYVVSENEDYAFTFYNWPAETYLASMSIKLNIMPNKDLIFVSDPGFYEFTDEDLEKGYTFDFTSENIPNLGNGKNYIAIKQIIDDMAYDDIRAILTSENGFKDYAYVSNDGRLKFFFLLNLVDNQTTYEITFRAYSENDLSSSPVVMLPMWGATETSEGYQGGKAGSITVTPVEGMTNVYDFTATVSMTGLEAQEDVNMIICYPVGTVKMYVSSLTIKAN